MDNGTFYPFLSPLYLVAKPASSACNMRCEYCYYLEKSKYYPKGTNRMDERMLEMFISRYIAAQNSPDVLFNWHGGEAMLCGTDFFRRALELQRKYGAGHNIVNTIQTNGLLLDRKWCSFFRENGFLVGISLDGPEDCHDMYRKKTGGQGSFADVMRGMEMLKGEGVEFNVLCAVNDYNSRRPLEVYDFFRSTGARFVQFTPVVERTDPSGGLCAGEGAENARLTPWSVLPDTWGRFLCDIFFRWVRNDVGDFFVNIFDAVLAGYVGRERATVISQKNAAMRWLWNTTATCTAATISCFLNIFWEISPATTCATCAKALRKKHSARPKQKACRASAANAAT